MGRDASKAVLKPACPSIQGEGQPGDMRQLLFNHLLVLVMLFFDLSKYEKGKGNTKNDSIRLTLLIKIHSAGTLPCR